MNPSAHHLALLETASSASLEVIRRDREGKPPCIQAMLEHLEVSLFDRSLSVQTWIRSCGIGDKTVPLTFHQLLGVTPKTYIEHRHLEVSVRLLGDTDLRIWRIAELLGFGSLGVFSKAFLRWTGSRPRDFRRESRRGQKQGVDPFSASVPVLALSGALCTDDARALIGAILEVYPALVTDSEDFPESLEISPGPPPESVDGGRPSSTTMRP